MAQLPDYFQEVRVLRLEPTDTVVLRVDRPLSREQEIEACEMIEGLFPRNRAIVLHEGEDIEIVREHESPSPT